GAVDGDQGRLDDSREYCEKALAIARECRDVVLQRYAILNLLRALFAQGRLDQALAHVEAGLALAPEFGSPNEAQGFLEAHWLLLAATGRLGAALDMLPHMLAAA